MHAPRVCALLLCALVLVVHGIPEEGLGGEPQVRGLDDAQVLMQAPDLATEASRTHLEKLEAQQAASDANDKMVVANSNVQAATQAAMDAPSVATAFKSTAAKKQAQQAKDNHAEAQDVATQAQERANAALKAARDAGIELPALPEVIPVANEATPVGPPPAAATPGVKPLPAHIETPPPKILPAPQATKLETVMKQRRNERLTRESRKLNRRYDEAKVEHQQAAFQLTQAMTKLAKVKRGIAEADSAMTAAKKESEDLEQKIGLGHTAEHAAAHEFAEVKHDEKLAEAFVQQSKVEEEVASSMAYSGGGEDDLEDSQEKRDDANERLKTAKAEIGARKLGTEKAKAAVLAAQADLQKKEKNLRELHALLQKADKRYANAKYDKRNNEHLENDAIEGRDQMKAEEEVARKRVTISHGLATAAVMKVAGQAKADEAHFKALIEDPEEHRKEVRARVEDQDGISEDGEPLISPDGDIARQYMEKFNAMPLPDNGRNPILEAEAQAQLDDTSGEEPINPDEPIESI